LIVILLGVVIAGFSFSWGYLAKARGIFPYTHINRVFDRAPRMRVRKEMHSRSALPELEALGYVEGMADSLPEKIGVVIHDEKMTQPGLNLYCAASHGTAHLITNQGDIVHSWRLPKKLGINHCEVLPNGDLIVQCGKALYNVDRDSRLQWVKPGSYHHCFDVTEDGRILALSRRLEHHKDLHKTSPILVDYLETLNQEGRPIQETSLLSVLEASGFRYLLPSFHHLSFAENVSIDPLHANYVEEIHGPAAKASEFFGEGDLVMSFKNLNLIAIFDRETMEILWGWGPSNLSLPHFPTLLDNGNILVFNNGVDRSEVLEVDPASYRVVWRYTQAGFFSKFRGAVQRLKNGNTLITESDKGYAHEVSPSGNIVWQFANPYFLDDGRRAYIWQVERIEPERAAFISSS
jgi:hypothetical protein